LESLQVQLQALLYDEHAKDCWIPNWGNSYTSRRFYSYIFSNVEAHPIFQAVWRSRCTPQVKFFAWLILVDRLNTKTMLQRRHLDIQDDAACVVCNEGEQETIEHLFFDCPFARE
jgi:hypothetical protein